MNSRRKLLVALGGIAVVAPFGSFAQQQAKVWRIGFFFLGSRQSALETGRYAAFLQGMRELGYIEGKHFVMYARFADGKNERLAGLAADLVREKADIIVVTGNPATNAARQATATIPIVVAISSDPVRDGFATSLARPGGNTTGLSNDYVEVMTKQLQLLKSAAPKMSRVAVLFNPDNAGHSPQLKQIETDARRIGMRIVPAGGSTPEGLKRAIAMLPRAHAGGLVILPDTFMLQQTRQIAELALKYRLPSIYSDPEFVQTGGLMSYGPNNTDQYRRAATFVDKILKGARPGDLPFEQPMLFNLIINGKTAKALGLTIPQSLLISADKVIE